MLKQFLVIFFFLILLILGLCLFINKDKFLENNYENKIDSLVNLNNLDDIDDNQNISTYLINLKKNTDRLNNFSNNFSDKFKVIEAINGKEFINNNVDFDFKCITKDYAGYIGLHLSMVKTWKEALKDNCEWALVFEDDSEIPNHFIKYYKKIPTILNKYKVINIDNRNKNGKFIPGCCLAGVFYHKSILQFLINLFDFKNSNFIKNYKQKYNKTCLNDYLLHDILESYKIPTYTLPLVKSGNEAGFKSTISPT